MEVGATRSDRSAIILAGGEGMRLRSLTRRIAGDERPKQFCPFVGGRDVARPDARSRRPIRATGSDVSGPDPLPRVRSMRRSSPRGHSDPWSFSRAAGARLPRSCTVSFASPRAAPQDAVALFPSDHYVSDDARFMAHVEAALGAVEAHPDLVVLLGIEAEGPEVQYGWIEAGERVLDQPHYPVYQVRRFWEKPTRSRWPRSLFERGCLWNSFVLVARVPALLALMRAAVPDLYGAFMSAWLQRSASGKRRRCDRSTRGSHRRTSRRTCWEREPANLAVLPVRGVRWSDWGEPARVLRTLSASAFIPRGPSRSRLRFRPWRRAAR